MFLSISTEKYLVKNNKSLERDFKAFQIFTSALAAAFFCVENEIRNMILSLQNYCVFKKWVDHGLFSVYFHSFHSFHSHIFTILQQFNMKKVYLVTVGGI